MEDLIKFLRIKIFIFFGTEMYSCLVPLLTLVSLLGAITKVKYEKISQKSCTIRWLIISVLTINVLLLKISIFFKTKRNNRHFKQPCYICRLRFHLSCFFCITSCRMHPINPNHLIINVWIWIPKSGLQSRRLVINCSFYIIYVWLEIQSLQVGIKTWLIWHQSKILPLSYWCPVERRVNFCILVFK